MTSLLKHLAGTPNRTIIAMTILSTAACGSSGGASPTTPTTTTTTTTTTTPTNTGLAADLVFFADSGTRLTSASNPAAGIDASGRTYLYYDDPSAHQKLVATSTDGLTFGAGTPVTDGDRTADSRRTLLPDGTWRLYQLNGNGNVMSSLRSTNGVSFTAEAGVRYTAPESTMGVYDAFTSGSDVVLLYIGDLMGQNNVRRAVSRDGGATFTFDRGNVLGDSAAGGGGNTYVDEKAIKLPDGRIRLMVMKNAEILSFISADAGNSFTLESGTRLIRSDFTGLSLQSLNDPVPIRLNDGRYRIYVAANVGGNNWVIVSGMTR